MSSAIIAVLLTGCTPDTTAPQVRVEVQITATKTQTYEVRVLDTAGIAKLDAMLGEGDRTASLIPASTRYRIVADTVKTRGKSETLTRTNLCLLDSKKDATSFVVIVADRGCHITYKS